MSLQSDVLRTTDAFAAVQAEWDRLAARFRTPLLGHDWLLSCAESFAAGRQLHVLLIRRDGALVAAAPLVEARTGPFRRLEMLGASALFEPTGFIFDSDDALFALCDSIFATGLPLWLQRLPGDGPIGAALAALSEGRGWLMRSSGGECPRVSTIRDWDAYLSSRSAQRRYDLRRARRRLDSFGETTFRFHRPTPKQVGPLLQSAVAVEASSWKGRTRTALAYRPALLHFFTRYACRASAAGQLRLSFLLVEGAPVAVQIAVEAYGAYWVLKIGYDDRWSHASPGLVITTECMRKAMLESLYPVEFLGTAERWILPWSTDTDRRMNVRYYPRSWRVVPAAGMDQVARVAAKIRSVAAKRRQHTATCSLRPR